MYPCLVCFFHDVLKAMNYSSIVFLLIAMYSSLTFSVNVNIQTSRQNRYIYFEEEPSVCEILTYVKDNVRMFFPGISKLDRGLIIIHSLDDSYYVRLSSDSNHYHCNENGMYVCKSCCESNTVEKVDFDYKMLHPSECNLYCRRCKSYFMSEDDHTAHLLKCTPSLFEKLIN